MLGLNVYGRMMKISKKNLKIIIGNILTEVYQSHTFEPSPGDAVRNVNPKCKHFESEGIVKNIKSLPGDAGKLVTYLVTNSGNNYEEGMVLTKTMDQLGPGY